MKTTSNEITAPTATELEAKIAESLADFCPDPPREIQEMPNVEQNHPKSSKGDSIESLDDSPTSTREIAQFDPLLDSDREVSPSPTSSNSIKHPSSKGNETTGSKEEEDLRFMPKMSPVASNGSTESVPDWLVDLRQVWEEELTTSEDPFASIEEKNEQDEEISSMPIIQVDSSQIVKDSSSEIQDPSLTSMQQEKKEIPVSPLSANDVAMSNSLRFRFNQFFGIRNSPNGRKDTNLSEKEKENEKLKRFLSQIQTRIHRHERGILKLNNELKRIETQMNEEIDKWTRWAIDSLVSSGRTYYETNILLLNTQIETEVRFVELLSHMSQAAQKKLQNRTDYSKNLLQMDEHGNVLPLDKLQLPRELYRLRESCRNMYHLLDQLKHGYDELKEQSIHPEKKETRKLKLLNLAKKAAQDELDVSSASTSQFYYHKYDHVSQVAFNRMILDERQTEGQLVRKWLNLAKSSKTNLTNVSIRSFFQHLSSIVLQQYDLNAKRDQYNPAIILYIERLIFPKVAQYLNWNKRLHPKDEQLKLKHEWLTLLNQMQIGINPKFQRQKTNDEANSLTFSLATLPVPLHPISNRSMYSATLPESFPYIEAIQTLTLVQDQTVPTDILYLLLETVRLIHRAAKLYAQDESSIVDADALFPIVVWVVIHAHLPNLHAQLAHASTYANDSQKHFGEIGLSISLIEAASVYLLQVEREKFIHQTD